jgi:L-threonylcarbamoyladenylate synthase
LKKKPRASKPEILKVQSDFPPSASLRRAVSVLKDGGLVVFPTDTFYGIGADPFNARAVERIFRLKNRPEEKALPLVVGDVNGALDLAGPVSGDARFLMERFWPGPLTLLLPKREGSPPLPDGGTGKIGVRVPNHPAALALLREWGGPLTATSANPGGEANPVTAAAAAEGIGGGVDLILNAGPAPGGRSSTIVDVTLDPPRLVRPGAVAFDAVMAVLGFTLTDPHDW